MGWNEAVITNDGIKLLADCIMGSGIVITSAFGGEGYTDPIALLAQKAIFEPRHKLNIAYALAKEDGVIVNIRIQNNDIDSAYTLKQIGLFAKMSVSNEEILFAIIQDEGGEAIPSQEENPEYLAEFDFFIPVSNVENINVNITSGTFATVEDIANLNGKKVDKEEGKRLSSNDYTDAEKNKLSGITTGATKNTASVTTPKAAGTAVVGTETGYARGDHVHPAQTSVTGNAGTATKLATARNINGMLFDGNADRTNYAVCNTDGATAEKTVACAGFTPSLGAEIVVYFKNANTAANPTLNVNSTGAKPIYYHGKAIPTGYLAAARIVAFRSTGSGYSVVGEMDAPQLATARNINGMSFDGSEDIRNFAQCNTAAAVAAKAVERPGFNLVVGAEITVWFTAANTAANPTLNVNNTGAKSIYYRGAAIPAGYLKANGVYTFRYNGAVYYLVGDIDTNTTYANMTAATASAAGKAGLVPAPAAGAQAKYLRGDGTWATPTNTTYSLALPTAAGLMSAADKGKLDAMSLPVCYQGSLASGTVTKGLPSGKRKCLIIASQATTTHGLECGASVITGLSGSMTPVSHKPLWSSPAFTMLYSISAAGAITLETPGINYTMIYFA